jgi:hypothetical protein
LFYYVFLPENEIMLNSYERIKKNGCPCRILGEGKDSRDGIHLSYLKEHAKPAGTIELK